MTGFVWFLRVFGRDDDLELELLRVGSHKFCPYFEELDSRSSPKCFSFWLETLLLASQMETIKRSVRFMNCFSRDRVSRGRGIAVLWKKQVKCTILNYYTHHIDLIVKGSNKVDGGLQAIVVIMLHIEKRVMGPYP